jgi:soluble lytic murein transglycosylase
MRAHFEAAARHSTAYYGQLARARLGLSELELQAPPEHASAASVKLLRAAELLYAIGERNLVLSFLTGVAEQSDDAAGLASLAELAARNDDARAVVGKTALARGLPLDVHASVCRPAAQLVPPSPAVVYSVARTESEFNQRVVSPAKAVGLMQVTPEAGRDTAQRFGVTYDWDRLVSDPVYNMQMGAAELAALLQEYRGSCVPRLGAAFHLLAVCKRFTNSQTLSMR